VLAGATEMTVTAVSADGTSVTFDDPAGAPIGSLFLGVENRSNGDVGWIAVTVSEVIDSTGSGSPSISAFTASGVAEVLRVASGSPSISAITSTGAADVTGSSSASGSPSISPIVSDGDAKTIKTTSGSPSISPIVSDGAAEVIRIGAGSPSISPITSDGDAEVIRIGSGSPSIAPIVSDGAATVTEAPTIADGSPSISAITASGDALLWPKVYLNDTETLIGATEMTVTAVASDGTSITFDDPPGTPFGAIFLGVENRRNGDVGWIAVTVSETDFGPTVIFGGFGA